MGAIFAILVGWCAIGGPPSVIVPQADVTRLSQLLHDRQRPRLQSQAALELVQSPCAEAEALVRSGLRNRENGDVFLPLAAAIQFQRDARFVSELVAALAAGHDTVRQAAADALSSLPAELVVPKLAAIANDSRAETTVRQLALRALGRNGSKTAAHVLIEQLGSGDEAMRSAAVRGLEDLTGRPARTDTTLWNEWWVRHKDVPETAWMEERLAFQTSRAHRLEGDLERAQSQVVRLHQQLYARLPVVERLSLVRTMVEQEDPTLRALAVAWATELIPVVDPVGARSLADLLFRLSGDAEPEVQRLATLALGKVNDPRTLEQLRGLLEQGTATVRVAAVRALAQQAHATGADAGLRKKEVGPLLQKMLADPAVEVVATAAEELGSLGVPETGTILVGLLNHSSASVRQVAAQALERVAVPELIDRIQSRLDDPSPAVRFGLVGALGKAATDGLVVSLEQKAAVNERLETVLCRDNDPGVRSRAASVLGECGTPRALETLWSRVAASEDGRVQEKAWAAFIEILVRTGNPDLVRRWQETLSQRKQDVRLVQMLSEICTRWQKREDLHAALPPLRHELVRQELAQGKWSAAASLVRDWLPKQAAEADREPLLQWLLEAARQALKEGNAVEAAHIIHEVQPYLPKNGSLADEFDKLEQLVQQGSV